MIQRAQSANDFRVRCNSEQNLRWQHSVEVTKSFREEEAQRTLANGIEKSLKMQK